MPPLIKYKYKLANFNIESNHLHFFGITVAEAVKRKRQARGEASIRSLLLAAESVFARVGYARATTNKIADEASVSPATLYQFFKNKEEIANAVAIKYIEAMVQHYDSLDYKTMSILPMPVMVEKLLFPLLFSIKEGERRSSTGSSADNLSSAAREEHVKTRAKNQAPRDQRTLAKAISQTKGIRSASHG